MGEMLESATCLAMNLGSGLKAIAVSIGRLADAVELHARATAGEFDPVEDPAPPATPTGRGMGMG